MPEKYTKWDVVDYLDSVERAGGYLEACLEEAPEDIDFLRLALSDIVRAKEMGRFDIQVGNGEDDLLRALADTGLLNSDAAEHITSLLSLKPPIRA